MGLIFIHHKLILDYAFQYIFLTEAYAFYYYKIMEMLATKLNKQKKEKENEKSTNIQDLQESSENFKKA